MPLRAISSAAVISTRGVAPEPYSRAGSTPPSDAESNPISATTNTTAAVPSAIPDSTPPARWRAAVIAVVGNQKARARHPISAAKAMSAIVRNPANPGLSTPSPRHCASMRSPAHCVYQRIAACPDTSIATSSTAAARWTPARSPVIRFAQNERAASSAGVVDGGSTAEIASPPARRSWRRRADSLGAAAAAASASASSCVPMPGSTS